MTVSIESSNIKPFATATQLPPDVIKSTIKAKAYEIRRNMTWTDYFSNMIVSVFYLSPLGRRADPEKHYLFKEIYNYI